MNHQKARRWILLEQSGELGGRKRRRLEAHLEDCAECRAFRAMAGRIESCVTDPPGPSVPTLQAVRAEGRRAAPRPAHPVLRPVLAAAMSVLLLAGAGIWISHQAGYTSPDASTAEVIESLYEEYAQPASAGGLIDETLSELDPAMVWFFEGDTAVTDG
ncbi:zf-HC2 domain-containing protein [Kiritimatiella glycovorans]|uniref:Putative transmembrane transcriptional regulator (Anti-sigma factor) n=1 Tax=Kiritimatiella glycovorans TaxID=1307763 RepID=A0A0G3EHQ3_9BACT|nr:zf-HC2 domain-containing protein [Kiritimatiella glycovorans]AKJ63724.1 putative transmembrane transcriptional regulator (anti-sigma factor) [Kiritimatiella glycovorans]